jgi:DNA primase
MRWCPICEKPCSFAYCGQHREQRQPQATLSASARVPCAAPATLGTIYQGLLAALPLSPAHRQALWQRGLADSEIHRRQYGTLPLQGRAALAKRMVDWWGADVCAQVPGFYLAERDGQRWWTLAGAAGLLIPVRNRDGHIVALKVRADVPGDGPKYTTISSAKHGGPSPGAQVHVPLHQGQGDIIRLTEGELKADVATVLSGLLTVSIPGVAMWRKAVPVLQRLHPSWVLLAFDADWRSNPHVAQALGQTAFALVDAAYSVEVEDWDPAFGKGIDDLLAAGHVPPVTSVALAFGALVRGQARPWTGQLRTVVAEEVPAWR